MVVSFPGVGAGSKYTSLAVERKGLLRPASKERMLKASGMQSTDAASEWRMLKNGCLIAMTGSPVVSLACLLVGILRMLG